LEFTVLLNKGVAHTFYPHRCSKCGVQYVLAVIVWLFGMA